MYEKIKVNLVLQNFLNQLQKGARVEELFIDSQSCTETLLAEKKQLCENANPSTENVEDIFERFFRKSQEQEVDAFGKKVTATGYLRGMFDQ